MPPPTAPTAAQTATPHRSQTQACATWETQEEHLISQEELDELEAVDGWVDAMVRAEEEEEEFMFEMALE